MNIKLLSGLTLLSLATVYNMNNSEVVHASETSLTATSTEARPIALDNSDRTYESALLVQDVAPTEVYHQVVYGETYNILSETYGKDVEDLLYNNNDDNRYVLMSGEELLVGGSSFKTAPADFLTELSKIESERLAEEERIEDERLAAEQLAEEERIQAEIAEQAEQKAQAERERKEAERQADLAKAQEAERKQQAKSNNEVKTSSSNQSNNQASNNQSTQPAEQAPSTPANPQGRTFTVEATAYSRNQPSLSNFTRDGTDLRRESRVIAVDPSVIPLGSTVYIEGYGTYRAADTGGAIKGNKIDIHMESVNSALQFGRRNVTITVVQ